MGILAFIALCFFCFMAYLIGYCAGAQDKQEELNSKYKLTI